MGLISETFQIFLGHPGHWLKDALRFVPLLMLFSWVSGLVGRATIFSFHSPPAGLSKELVAAMLPQLPRLCCDAQASQARNGNRPTRSLGLTNCCFQQLGSELKSSVFMEGLANRSNTIFFLQKSFGNIPLPDPHFEAVRQNRAAGDHLADEPPGACSRSPEVGPQSHVAEAKFDHTSLSFHGLHRVS